MIVDLQMSPAYTAKFGVWWLTTTPLLAAQHETPLGLLIPQSFSNIVFLPLSMPLWILSHTLLPHFELRPYGGDES